MTPTSKPPNRGKKRKLWQNEQMLAATDDVKRGIPANRAADATDANGVIRSTLKDRLSGKVSGPVPYLTSEEESLLVAYLLKCAEMGFGKTRRDV